MNALNGFRVLVVENDEDNLMLLSFVLMEAGMEVIRACLAYEAFTLLAAKPDLLISEVRLPEEDGISLICRIRKLCPTQGGHIPAIALSTDVAQETQHQALAAGYQAFITKPFDIDQLLWIVAGVKADRQCL
jgi:CheY-like chemotaxis protein